MSAFEGTIDLHVNMRRVICFALAIACLAACSNRLQASPTIAASDVWRIIAELNRGDQIGLMHAKAIVPKLLKTKADQDGFFASRMQASPINPKPDYVSLPCTRSLEEALQNYAIMSARTGDWHSFGISVQLDMDIMDRLATLKSAGDMKDNAGKVESASQLSLIPVYGIEAAIDGEDRYVIKSVLRDRPSASACLRTLAKRLTEMNRMAGSHMSKVSKMLYKGKAYHFGDKVDYRDSGLAKFNDAFQRSFQIKLQALRPILASAVKCLKTEKAKPAAKSH